MIAIMEMNSQHIDQAKRLADNNRDALGFVLRGSFVDAVQKGFAYVAVQGEHVLGFVLFHHRVRDTQTTLYDICVDEQHRGRGIGKALYDRVLQDCRINNREFLQLTCPAKLPSNAFYRNRGMTLHETKQGKTQMLNVYRLAL